ncbi:leucine-rich repeat and immunoglobulin-like domain-containing nogo receptor-interacting protein 1 [Centruroides vittatus]|uniref:leucine-rich repeat and immunoglobulin-like domain-containing nogo receptor-interacting protein 1 n=1 Tax=Centruroides vittatus TaxID=120091 RepID=UPI00350F883F
MKYHLYVFILISELVYGLIHRCPSPELIHPCICTQNQERYVSMKCGKMDFKKWIEHAKNFQPTLIDLFEVSDLKLDFVSKGTFQKLWIHDLILKNCEMNKCDLFYSLQGLQDSLRMLVLENCTIGEWIESNGNSFIHLEILKISNLRSAIDINEIIPNFPRKNLIQIELSKCEINHLKDKSLSKFNRLEKLELMDNKLKFVRRNVLPRPALHLKYYGLSNNPITTLADDMFLDMPRIKYISLSGTLITTLSFQIFMSVWDRLEEIHLKNIPIVCDCKTVWILKEEKPTKIEAPDCYQPENLKGINILNVTVNQLCAF